MSVYSLEEDLQFLQEFHGHVVQFIAAVKGWERLHAVAWEEAKENGESKEICYDADESRKIGEYNKTYLQLRTTINLELVRLRNVAARYQLGFNENWIYYIPTTRQASPNSYTFTFDAQTENSIIRDIELIRGALSNNLREERRQEARSRWLKFREDYLFPAAKWFVKPEHSKVTLIAGLVILVAVTLRALGFDLKTIWEIIKAIKGKG